MTNNNNTNRKEKYYESKNKLIKENFFVIDSINIENVESHMYGFSVSTNGILTDNYYKQIGFYENPEPVGVYVMVRKNKNEIIINQDFHGCFGLYIYENKVKKYFAISNSFLLLLEHLIGNQNLSFNKDFADNLVISDLYSYSLNETMINEIIQLPSNVFIIINIKTKSIRINYINYNENSIPFESEEGLKIIDEWVDKWGYLFRSLKKKAINISCDLSGGLDTRSVLSILLNSGIDINEILINTAKDNKNVHAEDFKIASNIAKKFGFKLNNLHFDDNGTKMSPIDTLYCTLYSKLGFHKEFYLKTKFYNKPKFHITGHGGEDIRGSPGLPIQEYINKVSTKDILGHEKEFYNSSKNTFDRSIEFLKKEKKYINDFEISYDLYTRIVDRNHFGKSAVEAFLSNVFTIQPIMDPDIKRIKYNVSGELSYDLISYIYIRFAYNLINFPIEGNRTFNFESIKKAKNLNYKRFPYKIKSDYNKNFFIDINRTSPVNQSKSKNTAYEYLTKFFNSNEFYKIVNKIYDKKVYNWAKKYSIKKNSHPFKHHFGIFSVAIVKEYLSLNKKNNKYRNEIRSKNGKNFINYIIN